MADVNNGAPAAAEPSTPLDEDILSTLSLSDDSAKSSGEPSAEPPKPPSAEAGAGEGVGSAPSSPDTPPSGDTTPAPLAAPTPPEGKPPEVSPTPSAPAPVVPPAAAPTTPPTGLDSDAALREASLKAQVDALQRSLQELQANPQPASAPASTAPAAPGSVGQEAEKPLRYNLTLPQATQEALLSDDPQKNLGAINAIVNDLGTIVHATVLSQVRSEMKGAFASLAQMATSTQVETSQSTARDNAKAAYYQAFPTHKNDLIEPIIRQQAVKMSAEYPGAPFDANFINALGARVNTALEALGAKPAEPVVTDPNPAPANPRPAAFMPSGTRGPGAPTGDQGADIMDTLSPFG